MELTKNNAQELTRYYISDCYEIDDKTGNDVVQKLYLGGDFYTAPAVYVKENSGAWQLYYIVRDYLGSITHIRNATGGHIAEYSYDAWGRMRNPENQTPYAAGDDPALFLGRGYTGHEHLPWFGVINMNQRLYDPVVGRFLAPDPIVQNPENSQNYNRYSYCINNPLKYNDLTGKTFYFTWSTASHLHYIMHRMLGGTDDDYSWLGWTESPTGNPGFGDDEPYWRDTGSSGYGSASMGGGCGAGVSFGSSSGGGYWIQREKTSTRTRCGQSYEYNWTKHIWVPEWSFNPSTRFDVFLKERLMSRATYFDNANDAYAFMWALSFDNGVPAREVSGWKLTNGGVIVLPSHKNTLTKSYNNALPIKNNPYGKKDVIYNNKRYRIDQHVHTHPQMSTPNTHPIGLSEDDLKMKEYLQRNILILYNERIYESNGKYNWKKEEYEYKDNGTWK